MTIRVEGPGGVAVEFPEGTPADTIKQAMQSYFAKSQPDQTENVSALESFGRGALQGASFGFSDEIGGVAKGAYEARDPLVDALHDVYQAPFSLVRSIAGQETDSDFTGNVTEAAEQFTPAYDEEVAGIRQANNEAFEQNPAAYIGGSVAGGVATTAIPVVGQVGRTAQGASLLQRARQGANAGALLGGTAGVGHSDGPITERAASGTLGALTGYGIGRSLPYLLSTGGAVVNAIGNRLQASRNPQRRGQALVAQALADDLGEGLPEASQNPAALGRRVGSRLSGTGSDPLRPGQPPAVGDATLRVMDAGGENTRNLLRAAANQKSPASETLRKHLDHRQSNQWRRLERGVLRLVSPTLRQQSNIGGTVRHLEPEEAIEVLTERAQRTARPLFEKAFQSDMPVTPKLQQVLQRPGIQRLAQLAQEQALDEGKDLARVKPIELLHRVKMQIDRQIRQVKRGVQDGKATWDVGTLVKLKKDLVDAIEVPVYKDALKAYAGQASIRGALQEGLDDGLKATPEAIRLRLQQMTPAEAESYRMGVARAVVQKVRTGDVMRDRTKNVFSSPDVKKLLRVIATDSRSKLKMDELLAREQRMSKTRSAVQGGSTTVKQMTQMDESAQALGSVRAAGGLAVGRIGPIIDDLTRRVARIGGMTPDVANEVIKAQMATGAGKSFLALEKEMQKAAARGQANDDLARMILRGTVGGYNALTNSYSPAQ